MKYKNLKDVFFDGKFHVGKGLAIYDKSLDPVVFDQLATMDAVVASQVAMDAVAASQVAMDAINNSSIAIGKYVASLAGLNPADYADMDAVAASQVAMDAVAASQVAMDAVAASQVAMDAVAASQVAMDAVAASQVAMDAVAASQVAMDAVAASQVAMDAINNSSIAIGKYVASLAGLNPADYADMDAVAASQVAMDAVFDSWLAKEAIWNSDIAVDAVLNNQFSFNWLLANKAITYTRNNISDSSGSFYTITTKKVLVLQAKHNTANSSYYVKLRTMKDGSTWEQPDKASTGYQDVKQAAQPLEIARFGPVSSTNYYGEVIYVLMEE